MFDWLDDKNKREKIAFLATGLAAVIAASWTGFTFLFKELGSGSKPASPQPAPTVQREAPPAPQPVSTRFVAACR
jgi:hypothetical protein